MTNNYAKNSKIIDFFGIKTCFYSCYKIIKTSISIYIKKFFDF